MAATEQPSWEDVLAQCEASAAHAQALLDNRPGLDPETIGQLMSLDLWKLSLSDLPPELLDRARAVHSRSLELQHRLVEGMRSIETQLELLAATETRSSTPRYLDLTA